MSAKQSDAANGKRRGPYKLNGNKCAVKSHNHRPDQCPGRGKIRCIRCGKVLLGHPMEAQCSAPIDPVRMQEYIDNREGKRIWTL